MEHPPLRFESGGLEFSVCLEVRAYSVTCCRPCQQSSGVILRNAVPRVVNSKKAVVRRVTVVPARSPCQYFWKETVLLHTDSVVDRRTLIAKKQHKRTVAPRQARRRGLRLARRFATTSVPQAIKISSRECHVPAVRSSLGNCSSPSLRPSEYAPRSKTQNPLKIFFWVER